MSFTSRENIVRVAAAIHNDSRFRVRGLVTGMSIRDVALEIQPQMQDFIQSPDSRDVLKRGPINSVEFLNSLFIRRYFNSPIQPRATSGYRDSREASPAVLTGNRSLGSTPRDHVQTGESIGTLTKFESADDYRNHDAWKPCESTVFLPPDHRPTVMKGRNNPHITGAHRRHYETDGDGLTRRQLREDIRGYDMTDVYALLRPKPQYKVPTSLPDLTSEDILSCK